MGNTRATVKQDGSIGQVQDYYAFGMAMNPGNTYAANPVNQYKYNGKELQDETGQYDYGARFYDPVIGRWNTIDPLAEKSRRWSPYNYVMNNPIRNIDPDGMETQDCCDLVYYMSKAESDFQIEMGGGQQSGGKKKKDKEPEMALAYFQGQADASDLIVSTDNGKPKDDQGGGKKGSSASQASAGNQVGKPLTHRQELSKYGQLSWVSTSSAGGAAGPVGATMEIGTIFSDKGWAQDYQTVYYSPGLAPPSIGTGFLIISPISDKYLPTFQDWNGLSQGASGSFAYISFSGGLSNTYKVWGFGVTASPASLDFMKGTKGTGTLNVGVTTLLGAPYQKETGASARYMMQMNLGGY